jgi:hypothetical protein
MAAMIDTHIILRILQPFIMHRNSSPKQKAIEQTWLIQLPELNGFQRNI